MADRAGFDEFVAARSPRLLRVAYLLTRDWNEAEDLIQTALMKAWFAWGRLDNEPEAYVRRIIATTFISWRRRRWTSELSHAELPERPMPDGTSVIDDRHGLWPALGRLPKRQRAVLVLRRVRVTATVLGVAAVMVVTGGAVALANRAPQGRTTPHPAATRTDETTAAPGYLPTYDEGGKLLASTTITMPGRQRSA